MNNYYIFLKSSFQKRIEIVYYIKKPILKLSSGSALQTEVLLNMWSWRYGPTAIYRRDVDDYVIHPEYDRTTVSRGSDLSLSFIF